MQKWTKTADAPRYCFLMSHFCCPRGRLKGGERWDRRGRERERGNADKWTLPPRGVHVSKTTGWSNVNSFNSWMVEVTQFWSSMIKTKSSLKFNGRKWTFSIVAPATFWPGRREGEEMAAASSFADLQWQGAEQPRHRMWTWGCMVRKELRTNKITTVGKKS